MNSRKIKCPFCHISVNLLSFSSIVTNGYQWKNPEKKYRNDSKHLELYRFFCGCKCYLLAFCWIFFFFVKLRVMNFIKGIYIVWLSCWVQYGTNDGLFIYKGEIVLQLQPKSLMSLGCLVYGSPRASHSPSTHFIEGPHSVFVVQHTQNNWKKHVVNVSRLL